MKTKFTNRELPHIWAQQKQSNGRGSSMFFDGPTIYSYGRHFPIAHFVNAKTVLFTTRQYSVTTSKHIQMTRWAIQGAVTVIHVSVPTGSAANNIIDYIGKLKRLNIKIAGARQRKDSYIADKGNIIANASAYLAIADNKKSVRMELLKELEALSKMPSEKEMAAIRERIKKDNAEQREKQKARLAQEQKDRAEAEQKWLNGEQVYIGYNASGKTLLRVKDDVVQTSRGATIPLTVAKALWGDIVNGVDIAHKNLGNYTVTSWNGLVLVVGCHRIERDELNRLAATLQWPTLSATI